MPFRIVLILAALVFLTPVLAQQDTDSGQPGAEQQSDQTAPATDQNPPPDNQEAAPADLPDFENEPIQRVEGQAPGRFIPSEQISQDLGVSFPTDI